MHGGRRGSVYRRDLNEGDQRGRAIMTTKCGGVPGGRVERIDERNLRACYLCEAVRQGQHGVYIPESLHHMLIMCPNVKMEALRVKLKADLLFTALRNRGRPPRAPPSGSESVGDVVAYDAVYNK